MSKDNFEKNLEDSKNIHEKIEIPPELYEMVERTIDEYDRKERLHNNKKVISMKKRSYGKTFGAAAACAVFCFTAALNISPAFAEDMQSVPIIGEISKVLTFRSYEVSDEDKTITADIPQIESNEEGGYTEKVNEEILAITSEYKERAEKSIADYKEAFIATGGTEEEFEAKNIKVNMDYEVKYESEDMLSLVLTAYEDWNASTEVREYYNINLKDNSEITLKDMLGDDYIEIANKQIKEKIAADESGLYFDESMGGFTTITDETNFYINENGNPVIVFQKYEIAAGAAGFPEFEIVK